MKKILGFLLLFCLLICSLSGCFSTDTPENPNNLGDYNVTIDSCRLAEDYEGAPIVIVKYTFANNADTADTFMLSISDTVFQNGVSLAKSYFVSNAANYSADSQSREVQPGYSLEVEVAYELINTTGEITVEISEMFSFSSKKVTKTLKLPTTVTPGGSSTDDQGSGTATPDNTPTSNLGEYNVTIDSCRLAKDRQGDPIVIIQYTFTNNSSEAHSFAWTISDTVFQNGVELNHCYSVPDTANYSSENQNKDVQSGHSITVEAAYVLIDEVSDISVEAKELISLSKKKVTKSFTIA